MHNTLKISGIVGQISVMSIALLIVTIMPVTAFDTVESHSAITNVMQYQVTWDNSSFSGFYYDIDKNLGTETITFRPTLITPTGATLSDQPDVNNNRGVMYETRAQLKAFKYKPWGQYDVIGFLGDRYFEYSHYSRPLQEFYPWSKQGQCHN